MPQFLFHGKYVNEGTAGLLKSGGTQREAMIRKLIQSQGGTCHAVYFGTNADVYALAELPDLASATFVTFNMTWNVTGRLDVQLIPLLLPQEFDVVVQKTSRQSYHAPGDD
jgi:uncharacterized protein with GYD domain